MRRRDFLAAAATVVPAGWCQAAQPAAVQIESPACILPVLPDTIAGLGLENLRDDYRQRLFGQFLPFWEKGGIDKQFGGLMCELNDDGSVASEEKFIWYQGRAIWIYSFLYGHFGKEPRYLEIATRINDFMVKHMHAGDGKWHEKVRRDGTVLEGPGANVYGGLFAAAGLAEFFRATGDRPALELARRSIAAAVDTYNDPSYVDTHTRQYTAVKLPPHGLRSQGHSMVLVWLLSRLLPCHDDPWLVRLQAEHVDMLTHRFWNPDYGIVNEYLLHDYSRVHGAEGHMFAGHAIETLWLLMHEALHHKDHALFATCKNRVRRLIEMCWDYVFDGCGDGDFFVFDAPGRCRGPGYD